MKITSEKSLFNFDFWSGAETTANELTNKEFNIIEAQLEDLYPDGIDETQLNDIFWFEQDFVAQMLGYDTWEAFEKTKED